MHIAFAPRIASTCWCMCMVILYCGFPATKWSYNWFTGVVLGAFYICFPNQRAPQHQIRGCIETTGTEDGNSNMVFWFQPILAGCWPISAPGPVQSKRVRLETCCRMHPKPIPQTNYKQTSSPAFWQSHNANLGGRSDRLPASAGHKGQGAA